MAEKNGALSNKNKTDQPIRSNRKLIGVEIISAIPIIRHEKKHKMA